MEDFLGGVGRSSLSSPQHTPRPSTNPNTQKLAATVDPGYIYTYDAASNIWTEQTGAGNRTWIGIARSAAGNVSVSLSE